MGAASPVGLADGPAPWQNRQMSTQDITLNFAVRRDAALLAEMSRDLIEAGLGWRYRSDSIGRLIGDADTVTLVARSADGPAGFGIMKIGEERAHLLLLAVRPAYQRRGIARRMVQWLVESAATAGVVSVHVELRAGNAPAQALYLGAGFAETLRLPGYYSGRETAIRMMRLLRSPARTAAA